MRASLPRSARSIVPSLAALSLATAIVWWIRTLIRTPNVPYTDEWVWAPLAIAARHGTLSWELLWTSHNGHRNLVGSLLFLAIDRVAGWNVIVEDLLGVAVLLGGIVALRVLMVRMLPRGYRDVAFALCALLLAGTDAYENFLIGYNLDWQICTAAVLVLVERLTADDRYAAAGAGAAALVASFSSGQGLLLWPIGLLMLVCRRAARPIVAAWCAGGVAVAVVYAIGYQPDPLPEHPHALHEALLFAAAFVGMPLRADGWEMTRIAIAGIIVTVLALALLGAALRAGVDRRSGAAWGAFLAYGLACTALATWSRAGLGPGQALSPRYASLSAFVTVGAVGFAATLAARSPRRSAQAAAALAAAVLGFTVIAAWRCASGAVGVYEADRAAELAALRSGDRAQYARLAYPDPSALATWLAGLAAVNDGPLRAR